MRREGNYVKSYELLSRDDCEFEVVETLDIETRQELAILERAYVESTDCVNSHLPARSMAEYHIKYYKENRASLTRNAKEKITCDCCGAKISRRNIAKHRRTKACVAAGERPSE
jgi:hypothetical protein